MCLCLFLASDVAAHFTYLVATLVATQYRATLTYTEALVARAVTLYWRRSIGIGLVIAVLVTIAALLWLITNGDRTWVVGLLRAVVALGILFPAIVYVVHYRNSMDKFREMANPIAEFIADDDEFTLSSDRGTTTLKWSAIREVWRYDFLWLLLFSRAQFVTVPLDGVSEKMRRYVLARIRASGGKVAD
jgi:hypothetical protein